MSPILSGLASEQDGLSGSILGNVVESGQLLALQPMIISRCQGVDSEAALLLGAQEGALEGCIKSLQVASSRRVPPQLPCDVMASLQVSASIVIVLPPDLA